MKLIKFFQLSLFCLLTTSLCAQDNAVLDSLQLKLKTAKEDSNKVRLLLNIAEVYESDYHESAKAFYRRADALSDKIAFYQGKLNAITGYSGLLLTEGEYDSSIVLLQRAVDLAEEKKDEKNAGVFLMNIGLVYNFKGDYENAIEYVERGRTKTEGHETPAYNGQIHDLLQVLNYNLRQFDRGIEHGEQSIRLLEEYGDSSRLSAAILNLGNNYAGKGMLTEAERSLKRALDISTRINNTEVQSSALLNLLFFDLKYLKLDGVVEGVRQIRLLNEKINSKEISVKAYKMLGLYYLVSNNFSESKKYLDSALLLSDLYEMPQEKREAYKDLSSLYMAKRDYLKSDAYSDSAEVTGVDLLSETLQRNLQNLEKKYETDRKEATIQIQNSKLEKRKIMIGLFGSGIIALLIILLLVYRNFNQKQELQKQRITELETEQRLNAAQAVLKGEEQERSRLARDLHDGLSGMLSGVKYSLQDMKGNLIMTEENRQAFERSIDMLDSSIKEMRRVAHNMMPEVLARYGLDAALRDYAAEVNHAGLLKVVYQSMGMDQKEIEHSTGLTIYRIVQELLNNVIKHAQATEALVQLFNENGKLVVNVEDNGKGFDTKLSEEKGGMGWRNIRSRVDLLKGIIDIQSSSGSGTSVNLEFNI